ncbi:hypothetical protein ABMA28_012780 [Loxostege sticticalis]|uniref:Uncharacterized protein n=1 Tax=Loxostege sticticalis TaxID=481309 RepID=A0ABD0S2J2_LOXSC
MLHRFRSAARSVREQARTEDASGPEPDAAYDARHYFVDDVADPWGGGDALERERLSQHAALRELVTRGDVQQLKARLAALGNSAGLIVNLTPGGANTLLYVASEAGHTAVVAALLEAGADGRAHPATRYGPLYAAAAHPHLDVARMLLAHFPQAAQQETVEKWLPLHAACIGGHAALVSLLLDYPYPEEVLNTYTDETGQWQYKAAFDINAVDVSGQSPLYIACTLGNLAVVEALLNYTVACERVPDGDKQVSGTETHVPPPPPESPSAASKVLSPQRGGISLGIHAIVSKLTGGNSKQDSSENSHRIRPISLDRRVGGDSCVSRAVASSNVRLLKRLLAAGARPDAPAAHPQAKWHESSDSRERRRSRSASAAMQRGCSADRDLPWTALALAARAKNVQMAELLLNHGATDPSCLAIRECARHGLADLLAKLLATKAYPDPDYKLNKSSVSETVFSSRDGDSNLTYSALCPTTPVMVNWRELKCQLAAIRRVKIPSSIQFT